MGLNKIPVIVIRNVRRVAGCLSLPPPLADDFFYTDRVCVLASESNVSMHSRHADRHNGKYLYDLYIVFTRPVFGSVHFYMGF